MPILIKCELEELNRKQAVNARAKGLTCQVKRQLMSLLRWRDWVTISRPEIPFSTILETRVFPVKLEPKQRQVELNRL